MSFLLYAYKCVYHYIGSSLTVYGCAEHSHGPNIVFEIIKFKIPLSLKELPGFIMRLDDLKRLGYFYHELCIKRLETKKRECCIMVKVIKEKVETKIKKQSEYFLRLIFISVLVKNILIEGRYLYLIE
jgi:hypothetical protein